MKNIKFLSSNIDRYEDLPKRIDKIKKAFNNKLYDFYLLQEIYDDNDLKYITPKNYYSLPVSNCGNSIISRIKPNNSFVIDLEEVDAICAQYDINGNNFQVISTHFTWGTARENKRVENAYRLDPTGEIAEYDVSNMEISPNCCPAQYMSETDLQSNNCKFSTEFVANNYSGMNYKDGLGCVCMTPKQATFLGHRGGNA